MERQQEGLGSFMLMGIFDKAQKISEHIGLCGINLYAGNEEARKWYHKRGFVDTDDANPDHLFIPIKDIERLFHEGREHPEQNSLFE